MPDSREMIRNTRKQIATLKRKNDDSKDRSDQDTEEKIQDLEDKIDSALDSQRRKMVKGRRDDQEEGMSEWVLEQILVHENDKKPLMAWMDKLEKELKRVKMTYKSVDPKSALELYYSDTSPRDAAVKLSGGKVKEAFSLYESSGKQVLRGLQKAMTAEWYTSLKMSNDKQALDKIVNTELKQNNNDIPTSINNIVNMYGKNHEEYMKTDSYRDHPEDKRGQLDEKMSDAMMKRLGIENPLKGKKYPYQEDVEQKKRVRNKLDGLSKDAKGLLASAINFSSSDSGPHADIKNLDYFKQPAFKAAMKFIKTNKSSLGKRAIAPYKELQKYFKNWAHMESVELDEAKQGELQQWEFPNERKAKQFLKDIENAGVAQGNLMQKNKKQVIIEILPGSPKVIDSAIAKYSKKNGGEQFNQKKAGPWSKTKRVGESVELGELLNFQQTATDKKPKIKYAKIMKGIRDSQGPFAVVAIMGKKVVGQKHSIKNSKMLPIHVNQAAFDYPGATISIESKGGDVLNTFKTFKESVELDEVKKGREKGLFTAVAIEVNKKYPTGKFAGQLLNIEKNEWNDIVKFLRAEHKKPGSKINVAIEDANGKVVKVFKESIEMNKENIWEWRQSSSPIGHSMTDEEKHNNKMIIQDALHEMGSGTEYEISAKTNLHLDAINYEVSNGNYNIRVPYPGSEHHFPQYSLKEEHKSFIDWFISDRD